MKIIIIILIVIIIFILIKYFRLKKVHKELYNKACEMDIKLKKQVYPITVNDIVKIRKIYEYKPYPDEDPDLVKSRLKREAYEGLYAYLNTTCLVKEEFSPINPNSHSVRVTLELMILKP